MQSSRLVMNLAVRGGVLAALLAASGAAAQGGQTTGGLPPGVPPGATRADVAPAPGLPGPQSVDPAPGAAGPYAGHTAKAFYDVDDRIASVQHRIESRLSGAQQKTAMNEIGAIKAEEKSQIARHGSLLDWARENLNHRLDELLKSYPALAG